ncbi:bifunctional NUDIX hydrolase/phosphatase PAP2 family protein [Vibrio sp. 10N]|uniref:bifunctional NUDIX hydrolase/phosphatase PAP2 family protein n=1 Tax=Vibrio sp. 10N TaxID=3058938 RepID=UPI0028136630|nr:bifunctional NUDIX hydrolase/phosphatase PAP2 family protein [Vibrio sp. 10N]
MTQLLSHWFFLCLLAIFTANLSFAASAESSPEVSSKGAIGQAVRKASQHPLPLAPLAPSIRGSLCIVRSKDRLLLVDEIITGKLSLPGGTIENNEDPRLTAQRETWEEAGLVVDVGRELGRTRQAIFFECHVESEIIAYEATKLSKGIELPIYFAPHFGVEVRSATLIQPKSVAPKDYRYPKQWPLVKGMYEAVGNQPIQFIDNLIESAPTVHQIELGWLESAQEILMQAPLHIREVVVWGGRILYVLVQPLFLMAFLPLFIWLWGRHFTGQLMFAVTATSLFILVAKQGFGFPVPHAYLPSINYTDRSGYSFPDLLIANWVSISTIVMSQIHTRFRTLFMFAFVIVSTVLVFYQFISGGAFLSDMLAGALLGALVGWHFVRHSLSLAVSEVYTFTRTRVWLVLTTVAALLCYVWPFPTFLSWLGLCLGMLLFTLASRVRLPRSTMCLKELLLSLVLILIVLLGYFQLENLFSHSGLGSLLLQVFVTPVLILVPALVMVLFRIQDHQGRGVKG